MTTRVAVRAQAKLNLWLRVLATEENGYHAIETLFHRLDLADDVIVALAPPGQCTIECSVDVGPPHENLAYRAANLYCGAADWPTGFHIEIAKRIPASGGLGGGSADAAATLLALNAMSPRKLDTDALAELGARLGADIPFLLTGSPSALAWARGDRMLELPALPQMTVALAVPSFGISTADAYGSLPVERVRPRQLTMSDLTSWNAVARNGGNDLSRSLRALQEPGLARAVTALRESGAIRAEMTGSGSVVFGVFESQPDKSALERATGFQVVLTQTALGVEALSRLD